MDGTDWVRRQRAVGKPAAAVFRVHPCCPATPLFETSATTQITRIYDVITVKTTIRSNLRVTFQHSVALVNDLICRVTVQFLIAPVDGWTSKRNKMQQLWWRPITAAAQYKAWTVFARSNAMIVGSNPTQGMGVCVLFCVGSGLATGWSPVEWVLPSVYRIKKRKKRPRSRRSTLDGQPDRQIDR
jgi:hypothetical protein